MTTHTNPPETPTAPVEPPAPVEPAVPVAGEGEGTAAAAGLDAVPPQAPKKDRRVLRAALRWVSVVAVFAVAGAGTAYGITRLDRTDVPGLGTQSDGRWAYPTLVRPPLPSGSPGPNDEDRNPAGTHFADLRGLVLPAPKGATADAALKGTDGWLATGTFLKEFAVSTERKDVGQRLTDNGLRHIAARGWTTADGTHTRVYLLQFDTAAVAEHMLDDELTSYEAPLYRIKGGETYERDPGFPSAARVDDVHTAAIREAEPYGAEQVREAYLTSGDALALIVQSRKGLAPAVPFQQTVALQSELLD
ncbi:hypothetical protein AB0D30_15520 [Streptomyces sp. NPDC048409]|uniref:hypothetical protein n=1 Tax=Streptomyces sp. NPDC048409 TaxID=3154723 RepID=UPI0034397E0B